jgi:PKHD-type hydroxylase
MLLTLTDVLAPDELTTIRSTLGNGAREDAAPAAGIIVDALRRNPLFNLAVAPRRFSHPTFHRNDTGGEQREVLHFEPQDGLMRVDVIVTVFLSYPEEYEGGELFVDCGFGEEPVEQVVGSCILHPASGRQRLAPVRSGNRVTAQVVVQSLVKDAARREMLYDIRCSLGLVELFAPNRVAEFRDLQACYDDLVRMWAEV